MSLKIDLPRPVQLPRAEPRTSPGFAPGAPTPGTAPRRTPDGFERHSPATGGKATSGSRFERGSRIGAAEPTLSEAAAKYKDFTDNFVKFAKDSATPPSKGEFSKLLKDTLKLQGVPKEFFKEIKDYARAQYAKSNDTSGLSVDKGSWAFKSSVDLGVDSNWEKILGSVKGEDAVGELGKIADEVLGKLDPNTDEETKKTAKDYFYYSVADRLAKEGVKLGKEVGGAAKGAELPRELESHRPQLKDIAERLARDPNLNSDAKLRKAVWSELKKLNLGETQRQGAREHLLNELSHLEDRFTAE